MKCFQPMVLWVTILGWVCIRLLSSSLSDFINWLSLLDILLQYLDTLFITISVGWDDYVAVIRIVMIFYPPPLAGWSLFCQFSVNLFYSCYTLKDILLWSDYPLYYELYWESYHCYFGLWDLLFYPIDICDIVGNLYIGISVFSQGVLKTFVMIVGIRLFIMVGDRMIYFDIGWRLYTTILFCFCNNMSGIWYFILFYFSRVHLYIS